MVINKLTKSATQSDFCLSIIILKKSQEASSDGHNTEQQSEYKKEVANTKIKPVMMVFYVIWVHRLKDLRV